MIHSGSRGLGHQVATDALTSMERAMARDGIQTNDRQLACARIGSQVRACTLLRSLPCTARLQHVSLPCLALRSLCPLARTQHAWSTQCTRWGC